MTDEQIIERLRKLRKGDVLVGGERGADWKFTPGKAYTVMKDCDGDLFVENDVGYYCYVRIDGGYIYDVYDAIKDEELQFLDEPAALINGYEVEKTPE